jgi:hypothetical protein
MKRLNIIVLKVQRRTITKRIFSDKLVIIYFKVFLEQILTFHSLIHPLYHDKKCKLPSLAAISISNSIFMN